jgi:CRISPR-associated protein Csx10
MRVITYRITLLEPALVTALQGDPNEGVSFDYLPGSVLRGMIVGKYLRAKNLNELDAANSDVRRLFFDGTTRYLNGYLLDRLDKRTLPTPLSWQHEKGDEVDIFDFAIETPDENDRQWQGVGSPFCSFGEFNGGVQEVRVVKPDRHISVHTARTRRFGRAMPADKIDSSKGDLQGAVYRYDALEAGQSFEAMILCDDSDMADLKSWLTGEAKVGGSRSGGYGRARLEFVKDEEAQNWRETGGTFSADVDGKLIITLLSDALLRDRNGQFVVEPCAVTHVLSQRLGVPLTLQRAFLRGEPIGGFNRKWGLPLPQALAIKMGSVFVYDAPASDVSSKLRELEALGIGERRAEGFGRVAVNWHTEPKLRVEKPVPPSPPIALTITEPSSQTLAQRMAERLLRKRLDELVVAKANEIQIINSPSNAQLSRLRNIIHDELMKEKPERQRLSGFLDGVRKRSTARRQFERARVGATPLLKWLDDTLQITDESRWKSLLGFRPEHARKVGGVEAILTDALRTEYILRLIDAVLSRTAKKSKKEGR